MTTFTTWAEVHRPRFRTWVENWWNEKLSAKAVDWGYCDDTTQQMTDWLTTNVVEAPNIDMNWTGAMQCTEELVLMLQHLIFEDKEYVSACEGDHLGKMATYAGAGDHVYYYMKFPKACHENIKMNFYASFVTEEFMDWNLLSEEHRVSMKVKRRNSDKPTRQKWLTQSQHSMASLPSP